MLDFLKTGWPPSEEDVERLRDYQRRQQLYESRHWEAFANKSAKVAPLKDKAYLIQDYPRMISTVFADLLLGEAPVFSLPEHQDQLDKMVRDNNLACTLYESELSCSFRGDTVLRLRVDQVDGEQQVLIEALPAYCYFVEQDPDNQRRILSQCLAWVREKNGSWYLVVEHHEPGKIVNELYRLSGPTGRVTERVPLSELYGNKARPPVEETRVRVPLLFHIPNLRHDSRFWGESDYTYGLESLFDEANMRMTRIAEILDKHADPKLVVPEDTLDPNQMLNSDDLQVIEIPLEAGNLNLPRYLTWDGQLGAAAAQLERCADGIFKFSECSPALWGEDKAGSIESSKAMIFRFMRTLAKVRRKRTYRTPTLRRILWTGLLLQAAWMKMPAPTGQLEIAWRDGLPKDLMEAVLTEKLSLEAGVTTRVDAIRRVYQVGLVAAQNQLQAIRDEQAQPPAAAAVNPVVTPPATA